MPACSVSRLCKTSVRLSVLVCMLPSTSREASKFLRTWPSGRRPDLGLLVPDASRPNCKYNASRPQVAQLGVSTLVTSFDVGLV